MAIVKRENAFQVKVKGPDGRWITRSFSLRKDAEIFETQLRQQRHCGTLVPSETRQITLNDYFQTWSETVSHQASPGWRKTREQLYRDYIAPSLGNIRLQSVTPPLVSKILNEMDRAGKSEQTRLHVFSLLRKMFGDALELFQVVTYNPVLRKLKPRVPTKEASHLNVEQVKRLLTDVVDRPYGVAIWLQLYLGLRIGEIQALRWSDIDLESGEIHIRRAYSRKDSWAKNEKVIKEYPKGLKQHTKSIPPELLQLLKRLRESSQHEFVATNPDGEMLSYEWYYRTLKRYCNELGLPVIGTHGLRHSTSGVYLRYGASREDLRVLFAHCSPSVTERYTHGVESNLRKVSSGIRLLPKAVSQKFPKREIMPSFQTLSFPNWRSEMWRQKRMCVKLL